MTVVRHTVWCFPDTALQLFERKQLEQLARGIKRALVANSSKQLKLKSFEELIH